MADAIEVYTIGDAPWTDRADTWYLGALLHCCSQVRVQRAAPVPGPYVSSTPATIVLEDYTSLFTARSRSVNE